MTTSRDDLIKRLQAGTATDADIESLTDDDIRQLVIHYATVVRAIKQGAGPGPNVVKTWFSWPRPLWERFFHMVMSNASASKAFWIRPADINNAFGIKE